LSEADLGGALSEEGGLEDMLDDGLHGLIEDACLRFPPPVLLLVV